MIFSWLWRADFFEVGFYVFHPHSVSNGSQRCEAPIPCQNHLYAGVGRNAKSLYLSVNASGIKYHTVVRFEIYCNVAVPCVTMHETRTDTPAASLQWTKESAYYLAKSSLCELLHFRVCTLGSFLVLHESYGLAKAIFSHVAIYFPNRGTKKRRHWKAISTIWRCRTLV